MKALILFGLRQTLRVRLVVAVVAIAFLLEWMGLRLLREMTFSFQGIVYPIGSSRTMFVALFLQLFAGSFIAAVYGIWLVPYLHQGARGQISFCYPVSRWTYVVVYGVNVSVLLLILNIVMIGSFCNLFGVSAIVDDPLVLKGLWWGILTQTLGLWTLMFALATCSLAIGSIPAFFIGLFGFGFMQVLGGLFRVAIGGLVNSDSGFLYQLKQIYQWLPPWGELIFELKSGLQGEINWSHVGLWVIWLTVFILAFRFFIARPAYTRPDYSA